MDSERIIKIVEALNKCISISLVSKGSLMTQKGTELAKLINSGKMIYDSTNLVEKPDVHWAKALLDLRSIQESQGDAIIEFYLEDLSKETKPQKFIEFIRLWEVFENKSQSDTESKTASSIKNLLKIARDIEKSADNVGRKVQLARLIDSHVQHIMSFINKNDIGKAREYLEVIKPLDWERGKESNQDKLYEIIISELSNKLSPEQFQGIGL